MTDTAITEAEGRRSTPVILVADDDPIMRRLVERSLVAGGFAVRLAEDGAAAEALWRSGDFAGVVSDLRMPGLDGVELMRRIRSDDADVPILLITGDPDVDSARAAVAAHASEYILKPFPPDELVSKLGAAVELVRLRSENRRLQRRREELHQLLVGEMLEPLAHMRFQLEVAQDEVAGNATAAELLRDATEELDRLWRIAADLSHLRELAAEDLHVEPTVCKLAELLSDSVAEARRLCRDAEQGITVEIHATGELTVDRKQAHRVLSGVLCALLEAAPPGERIAVRGAGGVVQLTSPGCGVPAEVWEHALSAQDRRVISAAGVSLPAAIGLSLARQLAESMGGRVLVDGGDEDPALRFVTELGRPG